MSDYIVLAILVATITGAIGYIVKQKKKGTKCIGCPYSGKCSSSSCNCVANKEKDNKTD